MSKFNLEEITEHLIEGYEIEVFIKRGVIEVWLKTPYGLKSLIDTDWPALQKIEYSVRIARSYEEGLKDEQ